MNYIFNLVLNGCTNLQWKPLWPLCMCLLKFSHIRFLKPPVTSSHHYPLTVFSLPPPQYFVLLLCIFLLEILAGVLAYIYYQQVIPPAGANKIIFHIYFTMHPGIFYGCVHGLILEQLTDIEGYNM